MKAIVTVGISGSGKTTWAEAFCRKQGYINVNRDNFRFTLFGSTSWNDYKFTGDREGLVSEQCNSLIDECAERGRNIVISDTNLSAKYRDPLVSRLKRKGYEVELKDFSITWEQACERDSRRTNGVGKSVLYRQWQQWLSYAQYEKYIPNESLPRAVIFDIDGTLADMDGKRSPFDWFKVGHDNPKHHVIDMLRGYLYSGYQILIFSGRDSVCRTLTEEWLEDNQVPYSGLWMRVEGSCEKDTVIKKEFFDIVKNDYNICAVVDDRTCMVNMWNDMGLNVISIGDTRDEF
jgi:predicted kinase